mmetsp:Transcript_17382/g.44938  ORF Transcript_17382/g.44938 Transcript_17382/m.44938 type:complete len:253 (+) Transcript_17382:252-1010(+)
MISGDPMAGTGLLTHLPVHTAVRVATVPHGDPASTRIPAFPARHSHSVTRIASSGPSLVVVTRSPSWEDRTAARCQGAVRSLNVPCPGARSSRRPRRSARWAAPLSPSRAQAPMGARRQPHTARVSAAQRRRAPRTQCGDAKRGSRTRHGGAGNGWVGTRTTSPRARMLSSRRRCASHDSRPVAQNDAMVLVGSVPIAAVARVPRAARLFMASPPVGSPALGLDRWVIWMTKRCSQPPLRRLGARRRRASSG